MDGIIIKIVEDAREELGVKDNSEVTDESVTYIDINKEKLNYQLKESIRRSIDFYDDYFEDKSCFLMSKIIFYGYKVEGFRSGDQIVVSTNQSGKRDNPLVLVDADSMLNKNEALDESVKVGNIIEWCVNPESNIEISEKVFKKLYVDGIRRTLQRSSIAKVVKVNLVIPPISKDLSYPDWEKMFEKNSVTDAEFSINNLSCLIEDNNDGYKYVVLHECDLEHEYYIVSIFYKQNKKYMDCGAICFDVNLDECYILHNVKYRNIKSKKIVNEKNLVKSIVKNNNIEYLVKPQLKKQEGITAFLSQHSEGFFEDIFRIRNRVNDEFKEAYKMNREIRVSEVCSCLLKENKLKSISLNDMVYVYNKINNDNNYHKVTLNSRVQQKIETSKIFDDECNVEQICEFPSNYGSVMWKIKDSKSYVVSYDKLSIKNTFEEILMSVIKQFGCPTTSEIAEEILFLINDNTTSIPSAFFVAKIYSKLVNLEGIISLNLEETISDNYLTIQNNSTVEKQVVETSKQTSQKKSEKDISKSLLHMQGLKRLRISEKSKNLLRKHDMNTLGDILSYSNGDLNKLRFLSVKQKKQLREEILRLYKEFNS